MQDSDNLQSQLAKEQTALAATQQQIEASEGQVKALYAQIAATQTQIEATQQQIEELRQQAATIEKRIALLREYMAMVDSPAAAPPPAAAPGPATSPEPEAAAPAEDGDDLLPEFEPQPDDELGDLSFVDSLPGASPDDTNPPRTEPVTMDTLDEETLTHEVLPRTQTFEEELLLVLAFHRKPIQPKDVARIFRRLDYAPKQKATESTIKAQLEADHHLFEQAKEGRIALTPEGREEAQRLLAQLV